MTPALQRRVQRYGWDRAAAHYEPGWGEQLRPAHERLLELATLRRGERVLDVACGTGLITFAAAASVRPEGSVVGVDLSQGMIDQARRLAEERGTDNVSFRRGDAESLEVPTASFDVVLCALGLMYVPEPLRVLREMWRLLEPGGRVAALVWGERSRCGWAEIFPIVDRRVASEVCPLFFRLGSGETLEESMRTAGFANVDSERLPVSLSFESDESACHAAFRGGPVALADHRFDEATRREVRAEYLDSIERFQSGTGYEIPGEFVVATARRGR